MSAAADERARQKRVDDVREESVDRLVGRMLGLLDGMQPIGTAYDPQRCTGHAKALAASIVLLGRVALDVDELKRKRNGTAAASEDQDPRTYNGGGSKLEVLKTRAWTLLTLRGPHAETAFRYIVLVLCLFLVGWCMVQGPRVIQQAAEVVVARQLRASVKPGALHPKGEL